MTTVPDVLCVCVCGGGGKGALEEKGKVHVTGDEGTSNTNTWISTGYYNIIYSRVARAGHSCILHHYKRSVIKFYLNALEYRDKESFPGINEPIE